MTDQTLSEHLLEYVDTLPEDSEESAEDRRFSEVLTKITNGMLQSRERFVEKDFAELEKVMEQIAPGFLASQFDELYTRGMLKRVPKMVKRTLTLSPLVAQKMPSPTTNLYVHEATRCYVFGLWQGCIALCRAALDVELRGHVAQKMGHAPDDLKDTIKCASSLGFLDDAHEVLAHKVRSLGNRVLHRERLSDADALGALDAVRRALTYLVGEDIR